jgi:hypothetical protein
VAIPPFPQSKDEQKENRTMKHQENNEVVRLWRPTGLEEMALLRASNLQRWPPRLPEQPIFYPVLHEEYARQIAREWNAPVSGIGYVTRFAVRKTFLERYAVQQVGGSRHLEYWIPAEDLEEFNDNIVGAIEVTHYYDQTGRCISGDVPQASAALPDGRQK